MEFQSLENNYFIKYENFFDILTKNKEKYLTIHKDYKLCEIIISDDEIIKDGISYKGVEIPPQTKNQITLKISKRQKMI